MKVNNADVFNHIIDTLDEPDLIMVAILIARERNENSLYCQINQRRLAEFLNTTPRVISHRVKELTNRDILVPITAKIAGGNLKGPAQYFFLCDIEAQTEVVNEHLGNGALPEVVVRSWGALTDILATRAVFQHKLGCYFSSRKIKAIS